MQSKSFQCREDNSGWKTFSGNSQINLRSTEVDLPAQYVKSDAATICRSKCYNRLLCYKRALDKVAEGNQTRFYK